MTDEMTRSALERKPNYLLLTTREAASYLGLAVATLNKWRCVGRGPRFLKLGRAVRYRREDLDKFLEINTFSSTLEGQFPAQHCAQGIVGNRTGSAP